MTILGLDPGLAATGYGVLRDGKYMGHGVIGSPTGMPLEQRIALMGRHLEQVVRRYRPDACAVETLFFKGVGARSVILAAQLRGGLFFVLGRRGIPVTEITPAAIKLALTGNGRASKTQMQYMVRALLRIPGKTMRASTRPRILPGRAATGKPRLGKRPGTTAIPEHAADALAAAYCLAKSKATHRLCASRPASSVERPAPSLSCAGTWGRFDCLSTRHN